MPIATNLPAPPASWPLDHQSLPIPNSQEPGYTPIYRNAAVPNLTSPETVYDVFNVGRDLNPNAPCLGRRPWDDKVGDFARTYEWLSYAQVDELRTFIGSALVGLQRKGLAGESGEKDWMLGLWIQNRPEFQIVDQAAASYSLQTVALYDSYDTPTAVYVLSHAEVKVCFTTTSHVSALLSSKSQLPHLKSIVLLDSFGGKKSSNALRPGELSQEQLARQWGATQGVSVFTWDELVDAGRKNILPHNPPASNEAIASLCYTSGTTGNPKAAKVAHRQLAVAAAGVSLFLENGQTMLSYLPLAHIYEKALEALCLRSGSAIGYFSGDVLRLIEDAQVLRPTVFPSVPRVLNRVAAQIAAQAASGGLKGVLIRTAMASKLAAHDATGAVKHAFWDRFVFSKVQAVLGGRVEFIISGSAPIRPDVLKVLRICFAADVREGYGQTENTGMCLLMNGGDKSLGSCGPPAPGVELRLKDCPELGYTSNDKPWPRGEILSRGQNVFPGYYKDEDKTRETLTSDGWLLSGDVGAYDDQGRIRIIDRVKNLVKLAQGEYVAIESVEGVYGSCNLLSQIWLYGDSLYAHLVAVAVPDPVTFAPFASQVLSKSISETDTASLEAACRDPRIEQATLQQLYAITKAERLKGYEAVRAIRLRMEPFTLENGLLTPTFKLKRPEAKKILKREIEELYAQEPAELKSAAPKL